ncbi:hypothetical protein HMPREF0023_2135 [Acinetobacter sp. ATCC 27244]|nr:hypothetical protein HMPREF0023_2135 [Acinetobacter sp. ATCC 27244]
MNQNNQKQRASIAEKQRGVGAYKQICYSILTHICLCKGGILVALH